jgi:hypothetical protein
MRDDWKQISGDVTASEYGATFAQLDTIGDTVYGVRVVQIINLEDACGEFDTQAGKYVTESSYIDVDGLDWQTARRILESCGSHRETYCEPQYPETVQERLEYIKQRLRDLHDLAVWCQRKATTQESDEVHDLLTEMRTYNDWYAFPRTVRAEMAASYGGFTDGQSMTFRTFYTAMQYHGIPASALWHPAEYDKGIVRLTHDKDGALTDAEGSNTAWYHYDMRGYLDNLQDETCEGCGCQLDSEAYICLDGGDAYCPECVVVA